MAIAKYITLSEVIAAAFLVIDTDDTRDEGVFREWAYDAIRLIGPSNVDIVSKCIDVENLSIEKPCNHLYTKEMNLFNKEGTILPYSFYQSGFPNSDAIASGQKYNWQNYIVVTEQRDCYHLSSNADYVVKAEMIYYRLPCTEDGELLIDEYSKTAILAYLEYQFVKRERFRYTGKNRQYIPISEIQMMEQTWVGKMRQARGQQKMPDPIAAEYISKRWMTLMPDFQSRKRHRYGNGRYRGNW